MYKHSCEGKYCEIKFWLSGLSLKRLGSSAIDEIGKADFPVYKTDRF